MNKFLCILCVFFSTLIYSQIIVKGKVTTIDKIPLEGSAVYFNNTMVGTFSNKDGEFWLKVKEGEHELIVSFLGYKRVKYILDTKKKQTNLLFLLEDEPNILDEIIVQKTKYDKDWYYNLAVFKKQFLGVTNLSKDCKILNPKTLYFHFDNKKRKLTAVAKEPLKIRHKGLGYLITYDLVGFIKEQNYVSYSGYSRYENLQGGKNKQKRWKKNRTLAYNGSYTHFYKSAINNKIAAEGFVVNQFKRVENKERPSEASIKKAKEFVKLKSPINFLKKITLPKTRLDSALVILQKISLPQYIDLLYQKNLKQKQIITKKKRLFYLIFKNNLSVTYNKEKEEKGYISGLPFNQRRAVTFQKSSIIPLKEGVTLDLPGNILQPLDILYEGYWSYEKFANTLPLDYQPAK
jgi:hypothetical protein